MLAAAFLTFVASTACETTARPTQWTGTYEFAHGPQEDGFQVVLRRDGSAQSNAGGPGSLIRGHWEPVMGSARIVWQDGWKNQLSFSNNQWIQESWPPDVDFSAPPIKRVPVLKWAE
ncbi:hypothetical protein MK280_04385 [Myxococcota bacterium]|nr:hypothetical protein [Myxococcota bacterium]